MRKRYFNLSSCLLLLLMVGCSKKAQDPDEGSSKPEDVTAFVTATKVTRAPIAEELTISGNITALPNQDVKISSLVPGRIAAIKVSEGDFVRRGEVVAEIDNQSFKDQLRQAEAAVDQAQANVQNALQSRDRNERLLQRGIAARKDVEDARTQVAVTEATLHQAEAAKAVAQNQVARMVVRSPIDGVVVKRFAAVGEQVDGTAAQPVLEVASLNPVELVGSVPSNYLSKIHPGQKVAISTDTSSTKPLEATVFAVSPAVDPTTNSGAVRIRINNKDKLLRIGMFLSARLPLQAHPQALTVVPQAIYKDEKGEWHVYKIEGENATAVPVQIGIETKDKVELLSGVNEGDRVVLNGGYGLPEHAKVKIQ